MIDVHDNKIISYEVNLQDCKITLHTVSEENESIDIIFSDVLAHGFLREKKGSIILDINKHSVDSFIKSKKSLLEERKDYAWLMNYKTLDELREKLINEQYAYYAMCASYGMNGWVLCKQYEVKLLE